jgi:superfamily I DNA/RNA helicase
MPNVLVLTFTRSLTEFLKTGCFDNQGREIFPQNCVTTLESWQRSLYQHHKQSLPVHIPDTDFSERKRQLSLGAMDFIKQRRHPPYDALFVDEAQDLLTEEVDLLSKWSPVLFFVGDDRQRIYDHNEGLSAVRTIVPNLEERTLPFHYRMGPAICQVADRILLPQGGHSLTSTEHYQGPKPATVKIAGSSLTKDEQLDKTAEKLKEQIRVYADLIKQGDRLGVIVARKNDRELVFAHFENDAILRGKSKIIRAKEDHQDAYDPAFDPEAPICILTVKGCKGLEFRAVHWLFADDLAHHHTPEHYYTVVTRAKTSLDILYTDALPQILARAYSESGVAPW